MPYKYINIYIYFGNNAYKYLFIAFLIAKHYLVQLKCMFKNNMLFGKPYMA